MAKRRSKSKPVWSKSGVRSARAQRDAELCVAYCAGRDVAPRPPADSVLVPYDIRTNRAHCAMLCRKGIISKSQLAAIAKGLRKIERAWSRDNFKLDPSLEDVHINIEHAVGRIAGERAAGAMHTARSRNDQCATDIRLWLRDRLIESVDAVADAVDELARVASRYRSSVMAGWTHGQPAMPMTLGHWAASHGFALTRDLEALRGLWPIVNRSPLGAAAGFGSSWPIDRRMTASLLGFDSPQTNSLDCVSTRWESEARFGSILAILMTHLSSLGQDLIHLTTPPRRLVALDPAFTTGSSIMPHKRNPDFAEVTRARATSVHGLSLNLTSVAGGLLSGYNRDSQWTKYWIFDLVDEVGVAPELFGRVMATIRPDLPALAATAREEFITTADLADMIASTRSVEFRRVYHAVGAAVEEDRDRGAVQLETINALLKKAKIEPPLTEAELKGATDPRLAVAARRSAGGPSPDDTSGQAADLRRLAGESRRWAEQRRRAIVKAGVRLEETIKQLTSRR